MIKTFSQVFPHHLYDYIRRRVFDPVDYIPFINFISIRGFQRIS